ncbi:DUF6380 family protein [Streptomyces sp. NPDC059786]
MDRLGRGDSVPGKRQATLRSRGASLTATTGRAPFKHRGPAAEEGSR